MQSKILGLGLCLFFSGSALAQNKTYKVQKGDTISGIASKFKIKRQELVAANGLENPHKLKLGMSLAIPGTAIAGQTPDGIYVTRNGDASWTIARRYNLTAAQLKQLNPSVDLANLKPGAKLNVAAATEPAVEVTAVKVGSSKPAAKPSLAAAPAKQVTPAPVKTAAEKIKEVGADLYIVKEGDNDWVIAHKLGMTASGIRQLNPSVDWHSLQIGTKLKVPSGTATKAAAQSRINTRYAVVTGDNAVIRRAPSTSSEKVTLVSRGIQVKVLDEESGWYKLKFPKGTVGWMRGDLLRPLSTLSAAKVSKKERIERTGRSRTTAVAKLSPPAKSRSKARNNTRLADKGSKSSTRVASVAASGVDSGDLLDRAMALRGTRYRWGGTSRSGFDCSGFVGSVYKSEGVKLPRTSRDMARVGAKVPKDQLKEGDLVFFQTGRRGRISHVGIYAGNGKFIHSSSGKGAVRVDSLNDGYYAKRLVTAKRVTKPASSPSKPSAAKAVAAQTPAKSVPVPTMKGVVTVGE